MRPGSRGVTSELTIPVQPPQAGGGSPHRGTSPFKLWTQARLVVLSRTPVCSAPPRSDSPGFKFFAGGLTSSRLKAQRLA
eukprot:310258-Rhodomonas_salina.4